MLEMARRTGEECLLAALEVHDRLGEAGLREVQSNAYGDVALEGDIRCEEAVIDRLRLLKVPALVYSEEHGIVELSSCPEFLVVIDGIDGSALYRSARGSGCYGTMFSMFAGADPFYGDYLTAGVMEHASRRLFMANRGEGATLILNADDKSLLARARCARTSRFDPKEAVCWDDYRGCLERSFGSSANRLNRISMVASSANYTELITGRIALVVECTRKMNLELACAAAMISESGGVMLTRSGIDFLGQRYKSFAQDENVPVISAATHSLALSLIEFL